ncbi:MAG: hypothetical protein EHM72_17370 [Calditrichaeota bacterium]|nr:MAG: hypothetical protein EHM72_17370 [Calditrichota bacterium]
MNRESFYQFYYLSQAIIYFFSALLLFSLWEKIEKSGNKRINIGHDFGLVWLAMAIGIWGFVGLIMYYRGMTNEDSISPLMIFASTLNSTFFWIALAYFDYGPLELKVIQKHWRWRIGGFLLLGLIIAGVTGLLYFVMGIKTLEAYIPDLVLSTITAAIMGSVLFKTFTHRGFTITAYLAILATLLLIYSQVVKIWPVLSPWQTEYGDEIFLLTSKLAIIAVFLALATSWTYERGHLPNPSQMMLTFIGLEKSKWNIQFTLPHQFGKEAISLTENRFEVLLKFAVAKKRSIEESGGWLDIDQFGYYPMLGRIAKDLHTNVVTLFENSRGFYRLRIPAENIDLNKEVLDRFPTYKNIIAGKWL